MRHAYLFPLRGGSGSGGGGGGSIGGGSSRGGSVIVRSPAKGRQAADA